MNILRTPDSAFENLDGYPFAPNYVMVGDLRLHYVDEGPRDADVVLMLHGEPSWSYLYRKMIPIFAEAGYRAVAPDLVGFGKSDKPTEQSDYTYARHLEWMQSWLDAVDLKNITLVCQDWGSLIGLRLAVANQDRFDRIVLTNGGLPVGDPPMPEAFQKWKEFSIRARRFGVSRIIDGATVKPLTAEIKAAYNAPFPDESYKSGARIFPSLVPDTPEMPQAAENRAAWKQLMRWQKPFLTAFSDSDPITKGGEKAFQRLVPGAKGQPHRVIEGGGHFVQEDCGEALAQVTLDFMRNSQ